MRTPSHGLATHTHTVIFFFLNFESHVDQTKDRPGIRVERQKTEDLSEGAQTAITWSRWRFSET